MNNLILSLQITALGMGLVFGAIIVLWLMMILLTALSAEKEIASEPAPKPALVPETDFKAQAAAIAAAIALAEQGQSTAHPLAEPPTTIVSAWQLGMRTRQSSEKGNFRRH
jgi:sodium pump decarboxylase gamma subunit